MKDEAEKGAFDKRLEPFAKAIGELCVEWAHLEGWIDRLFMAIGQWDFTIIGSQEMVRCLDPRDKLKACKIGVVARGYRIDLCNLVMGSVDYIDNDLRPARNRYVHDVWMLHEDLKNAMRFDRTPKVIKPLKDMLMVVPGALTPVTLEEVRELVGDVVNEMHLIKRLTAAAIHPPPNDSQVPLPAPPQRLYLRRQQEMQRQKDRLVSALRRQPKSSRE